MLNFKIQGTLGISYIKNTVNFTLFPNAAYLCPKNTNAILFPRDETTHEARIETLKDNKISINHYNKNMEVFLIELALQCKSVELLLEFEEDNLKIIGFNFPVN